MRKRGGTPPCNHVLLSLIRPHLLVASDASVDSGALFPIALDGQYVALAAVGVTGIALSTNADRRDRRRQIAHGSGDHAVLIYMR